MVITSLCIILEFFFLSFEGLHKLYVEIITINMIITKKKKKSPILVKIETNSSLE